MSGPSPMKVPWRVPSMEHPIGDDVGPVVVERDGMAQ